MFTICIRTRGAVTLFRRKIPADLRGRFAVSEIVRSLGRTSVGERRRLAGALWQETEVLFMTVRNQAGMNLDEVAALTRRVGAGFFAEAEVVEPVADAREIDTPQGRSAFLRGMAAAIGADQKRDGRISATLLANELARQGISLVSDQEILLRDIVASDLVRRAQATADSLHDMPSTGLAETADDADAIRVVNVLRSMKTGGVLSDFISPRAFQAALERPVVNLAEQEQPEGYGLDQIKILPLTQGADRPPTPHRGTAERSGLNATASEPDSARVSQVGGPTVPEPVSTVTSDPAAVPRQSFDDLWSQFTREKAVKKEWGQQQEIQAKSTMRVFIEICTNRPPGEYTKQDADEFKLVMLSLPARYAHNKRWCDLRKSQGLKVVAETAMVENQAIAQAHRKGDRSKVPHKTLDPKTYDRHYSNLAEFWRWADRKRLLTLGHGQIFDGLYIDLPKVSGRSDEAKAKRDEWHDPMLVKLFSACVLTGFRSRYWWKREGKLILRDDRYWGCLLGPHHGMRREEFFQLRVEHVVQDDDSGIWYFNLKARGLRLKDIGSPRLVPLHNNILELGFVDERVIGRPPGDMLFPEAIKQDAAGYHGARFGDWFGRFCDWLGAPDNNDFHSFRVTFINRLRRAGVAPHLVDELAGHESHERRSVQEEYDRGLPLPMLKELIDKLVLPIDVSALKEAARQYGRVDFMAYEND